MRNFPSISILVWNKNYIKITFNHYFKNSIIFYALFQSPPYFCKDLSNWSSCDGLCLWDPYWLECMGKQTLHSENNLNIQADRNEWETTKTTKIQHSEHSTTHAGLESWLSRSLLCYMAWGKWLTSSLHVKWGQFYLPPFIKDFIILTWWLAHSKC